MKIIHIIARLNVGGPTRNVVWLTREFNDAEFTTTLVCGRVPPGEEDMEYLAQEAGIVPLHIDQMSRELSVLDIPALLRLYSVIRRARPDIVHTHTAKAGAVGRAAALLYRWLTPAALIGRPRRLAVVHTFHGHVFHSYYGRLMTRVFLAIERLLARVATDKIVVISQQQFREINSDFHIGRPSQFEIVPLGIDLEPFRSSDRGRAEFRREMGVAEDVVLVGYIGRLVEVKNVGMLLEVAAGCVKEAASPPMHFVVVGDGHLRGPLEKQAQELSITGSVSFSGGRRDIEAVYAGLDIVALTSLNEGTPLSLIEAMAAGRPVISTVVGGVADLLGAAEHEMEGFTIFERGIGVARGDDAGFLKGLIYLAKSEKLRQRLAGRGREFVEAEYSTQRLVENTRTLYRRLYGS